MLRDLSFRITSLSMRLLCGRYRKISGNPADSRGPLVRAWEGEMTQASAPLLEKVNGRHRQPLHDSLLLR